MERKQIKRQGGFTLIELITVIIILGILAAVIAPKYFSMSDEAQDAAYKGALNEAVARFNGAAAKFILDTGSSPTVLTNLYPATYLDASDAGVVTVGDYDFVYTAGSTDDVSIAVREAGGTTTLTYSTAGGGGNVAIEVDFP